MSLAFVFPGQGSQSIGMLAELAAAHPQVLDTFAEASDALGYDLWALVQGGSAEQLNQTHITQPAMLTAGVAAWRVWLAAGGGTPAVVAGHSLGEYTALVAAGSLGLGDGAALVAERGRLMQAAVPEGQGAMAAILGLDDDKVIALCAEQAQGEVLAAVNFNSPGQVVVAGAAAAVERMTHAAKEAGAKRALLLPVSVPSHCALMRPAADALAEKLSGIAIMAPSVPVLHNCDVASHTDAEAIRQALTAQLYSPVRWVETVQKMAAQGVDLLVECGPGKVLIGLNKRIEKNMQAVAIYDDATLQAALAATPSKDA